MLRRDAVVNVSLVTRTREAIVRELAGDADERLRHGRDRDA
jgi:hypothetical protein